MGFAQYASDAYQALLKNHGLAGSMSRKGNYWDNAVMKCLILNLNLKMERVRQRDYANHSKAIYNMDDYIVNFYNFVWLHSKLGNWATGQLGNWSTNLFKHQLAAQPTY